MKRWVVVAAALCNLAAPIAAQNVDIEAVSAFRLNFTTPGARTLGMGGAFLALADDVTAAEINPAGLAFLIDPEAALEVRSSQTTQRYFTSGLAPELTREDISSDRVTQVSFAGGAFPIGGWAVSAYYHQPINQELNTGVIGGGSNPIIFLIQETEDLQTREPLFEPVLRCLQVEIEKCTEVRLAPYRNDVRAKMDTYGFAVARRIGDFGIGGALRFQQYEQRASAVRLTPGGQVATLLEQTADDDDVTFSLGLRWNPHRRFAAGLVYKKDATFEATTRITGAEGRNVVPQPTLNFPNSIGVGFYVLPFERLSVTADLVRVRYSSLVEDMVLLRQDVETDDFEIADATEIRVGAEYRWTDQWTFRAGYWYDPEHSLSYLGPFSGDTLREAQNQVTSAILYPGGRDEEHYTLGAGYSMNRFRVDAGVDVTEDSTVFAVSAGSKF
jgi:long-chain fatty acid transport protein